MKALLILGLMKVNCKWVHSRFNEKTYLHNLNLLIKYVTKVPILKECHFRKMKLFNIFVLTFGRDCHFLIRVPKTTMISCYSFGTRIRKWQSHPKVRTNMLKSVQLPRVSFGRKCLLIKLVLQFFDAKKPRNRIAIPIKMF